MVNNQVASPIQQQGLSTRQDALFNEPLVLESGRELTNIIVAFETYGKLNDEANNAILVCHALTGDALAAGKDENGTTGWWADMIGPGKTFDTNKFFVVCANVLGGCQGTTGPASINPETNRPWGMSFPVITIKDMVKVQRKLIELLGVNKLKIVAGGSMGGMQVLEWAVMYPELVENIIPIATSCRLSALGIAYNEVGRRAIMQDPDWQGGNYYPGLGPVNGLSLARMIATITYKSDESFSLRFGRNMATPANEIFDNSSYFEVESYLRYQGQKLTRRFDANSYLYLIKAMDFHDISRGVGTLEQALNRFQGKSLVVGINSDFLYPSYEQRQLVTMLHRLGKEVDYYEIDSPYGHDAFLIEFKQMEKGLGDFIKKV
jgi:homoserine O-acetyltransferase